MELNKKGQMTIMMTFLIVGLFIGLIFLLVIGLVSTKINDALNINETAGAVNIGEESAKHWGKFNEMVVVGADWWGMSIIFGMILGLFASSYVLRNRFPKWGLIFDIFIILFAFIVSLYVSTSYSLVLDAMAEIDETFLEDHVTKTSMFMVNLPIFIVIIGVVMMILFHSSIPRKPEERIQEGGFLQGVQ